MVFTLYTRGSSLKKGFHIFLLILSLAFLCSPQSHHHAGCLNLVNHVKSINKRTCAQQTHTRMIPPPQTRICGFFTIIPFLCVCVLKEELLATTILYSL